MAELYQWERSVISKHIRNVFSEGELAEVSNVQNLHIANSDKPVNFYSLDVIISVGYRVKLQRGGPIPNMGDFKRIKNYKELPGRKRAMGYGSTGFRIFGLCGTSGRT